MFIQARSAARVASKVVANISTASASTTGVACQRRQRHFQQLRQITSYAQAEASVQNHGVNM